MPSEKILVNQNGVNAGAIDLVNVNGVREDYGIPAKAFVIGYIGGMETFRRLPEVIGYFAQLRRIDNGDFYFIIVGDGEDMPAVKAAIESDKDVLDDAVKLTGWQEQSRLPEFLNTFDLAILPFTNDYCSPLKLFEYLGAGVPTIGPDTPAVREVFENGVHLRLIKQDGSDFIRAVIELREDPGLRTMLRDNGKKLVLNEYTWVKNAERLVKHINKSRNSFESNII
jgi:glycosyltransferase involved in cell wall biosynthesis